MKNGYKIIDAHCHIYPDTLAAKAAQNISNFYDGIPHITGSVSVLLETMGEQGIDWAVVNSAAMSCHQVHGINRFLAETITQHPLQLFGFGTLHPGQSHAELEDEVQFLIKSGFRGIKLHHDMLGIAADNACFNDIYAICGDAGLKVLLHTGDRRYRNTNPEQIRNVLKMFPKTTFIGGHFAGRDFYLEAADTLHHFDNLYCDCSSSFPWLTEEDAMYCIHAFGADHVLFGTDFPVCRPGYDLNYFFRLPLTCSERKNILSENAIQLLHLFE